MFVVTDTTENVDLMEKLVEVLETPEPQVMIEAQIVECTVDSDLQLGIETDWGAGAETFLQSAEQAFNPTAYLQSLFPGSLPYQGSYFRMYTTGHSRGTLDIRVRSLIERGKARILSQPRVLVASGQTASITSGQKVPLATVTTQNNIVSVSVVLQDVNISLTVTPIVIGKDYIQMVIEPQVQTVSGYSEVQGISTPLISTRRAKTEVVIKDGQQISIGGLMREQNNLTTRGIPILCDIPLLGYLFESQREVYHKSDILFQIRPIISDGSSEQPERMIVPPGLSGEKGGN
jgi:type IV pilus assembly protein PilQ